jgi:hypothetical protein
MVVTEEVEGDKWSEGVVFEGMTRSSVAIQAAYRTRKENTRRVKNERDDKLIAIS